MLVSDILKRENNNLNFIRLWLAFSVIIGHIGVFISNPGPKSILKKLFPFTYCGNIAVVVFFFFSGLFVTNSLFEKKNVRNYIISRVCRIYPALLVCLILSAIICFAFSSLDFLEYLKSASKYITDNLLLKYRGEITGVSFMRKGYPLNGRYASEINGSLWIIPYEVKMYVFTLALYLFHQIIKRYGIHFVTFILLMGLLSPFIFKDQLFGGNNPETLYLLPSFCFGSLLALYKDKIYFDYRVPLGLFCVGYIFRPHSVSHLLFFLALDTSCLYLATLKIIRRIPTKIDISYSVYIYGWFIQQLVQYFYFSYVNWYSYAAICIILSGIVGIISYYGIERPSITLKKSLENYLYKHFQHEKKTT